MSAAGSVEVLGGVASAGALDDSECVRLKWYGALSSDLVWVSGVIGKTGMIAASLGWLSTVAIGSGVADAIGE